MAEWVNEFFTSAKIEEQFVDANMEEEIKHDFQDFKLNWLSQSVKCANSQYYFPDYKENLRANGAINEEFGSLLNNLTSLTSTHGLHDLDQEYLCNDSSFEALMDTSTNLKSKILQPLDKDFSTNQIENELISNSNFECNLVQSVFDGHLFGLPSDPLILCCLNSTNKLTSLLHKRRPQVA